jgi:hypothetical protein
MVKYTQERKMEDRRKLRRKYLAFFTRVFDRNSGQLLGHLADLTAEGMMIISEKPLRTEELYSLEMDLSGAFFEKERLTFQAESIWCKPDIDPSFYNTGFRLLKMSAEDITIIERIIKEYGIRD